MSEGEKLRYCLDSLVNQTIGIDKNTAERKVDIYEIIAVDDCSTDNSYEILKEYEEKYRWLVKVIKSPENLHQGGAKNIGLAVAKGEWLGFIDSDDWVTSDYYERLIYEAESTGADMSGCDYHLTDRHDDHIGSIVHNGSREMSGILDREKYKRLLLDGGSLVVKVYRREIILGDIKPLEEGKDPFENRLSIFPEKIFYEDNAVRSTWMLRAHGFAYIEEPLYSYYQHSASTVHSISNQNLCDRMTAGRMMLEEAQKKGYFEAYREEIEYLFIRLFYVNTLFSAMPKNQRIKNRYSIAKKLVREVKKIFPDFQKNKYYRERVHKEEKKLIAMQMRSHFCFYFYYKLLWSYRFVRSKLRRG